MLETFFSFSIWRRWKKVMAASLLVVEVGGQRSLKRQQP